MFTLRTPAKINWSLSVRGLRPDGYHEILSLIQAIDLFDTLEFSPSDGLTLITEAPIKTGDNLVMKAALALRERFDVTAGARITLIKEIPLSAGLGGGSSDAACALKGLVKLWGLEPGADELMETALALGSDVPFFMAGTPAVARGRGEALSPAALLRPRALVLARPPLDVSAKWAYEALRAPKLTNTALGDDNIRFLIDALNSGGFSPQVLEALVNDLEGPVTDLHPEVGALKETLMGLGAGAALMSGSGPTVFGLFDDMGMARKAAAVLGARCWSRAVETLV